MKRWVVGWALGLATLAAALMLGASSVFAAGTDVVWRTVPLGWASYGAGTAATGDSIRWQHIGDESDSTRTAFVSTDSWAWDAISGIGTVAGPVGIAYVTCGCQTNNLAVGNDSLHMAVEKRAPNGKVSYNATMTAAVGTVLTLQGAPSANGAVWRGQLQYDNDSVETLNLIGPGNEFRLVIKGDQGSTTPAQGKCSLWLTYPSRRASQ